jgi:NhaC family Na+:H+ antiporter
MSQPSDETGAKPPALWICLVPIAVLIIGLVINVRLFGDNATYGGNQLALLLAAMVAGGIGHFVLGAEYKVIEGRAIRSIILAMEAVIILLIVGALIALWIISGVVPAMVYYGIEMIGPSVFLLVACLVCSVVSLSIGSSWSTMGTVGLALIGIGQALGFPLPLVAGAIISGAYFGDKMSPLSDTTNLAPGIVGSELFIHIRHMFYTTIPAYSLTIVAFGLIGLFYKPGSLENTETIDIAEVIAANFNVSPWLLLVPATVIFMAARQVPAIPALVIGALLGAACTVVTQPQQLTGGEGGLSAGYMTLITTAYDGYALETGNAAVDDLLSRGGMMSMSNTVLLILMAMLFGGVMEATGMLQKIAETLLSYVRGAGSLIGATVGTCLMFNIVAATVTSVLVPWNTCGAFAYGVLGVPTFAYAPFCFFNWLSPIISVFMAGIGMAIKRTVDEAAETAAA